MLSVKGWQQALRSADPDVTGPGLTAFVELARRVASEEVDAEVSDEAAFLRKWLAASPDCADLVAVWESHVANPVPQLEPVVDCIAHTVAASRRIGQRAAGANLARTIIRNHMRAVYRTLSSGTLPAIASTLRMLFSIASHGAATTRELQEAFDFSHKSVRDLLKRRKKADNPKSIPGDIRTLTIRFILAFLVRGETPVRKALLEVKNLVSGIFADIKRDPYSTIELVFSSIKRGVVQDPALPRSVKVSFFSKYVMDHLVELYSISNADDEYATSRDGARTIADLVHDFLWFICTTPGVGICFADLGWYPATSKDNDEEALQGSENQESIGDAVDSADPFGSGATFGSASSAPSQARIYNRMLFKLMSSLNVGGDMRQRSLLLGILAACPELVHQFWSSAANSLSFEPRSSTSYIANVALATSIIKLPVPTAFVGKTMLAIVAPPPLQSALSNILPSAISRQLASRALQHSSRDVRFACTSQLTASLTKLAHVLDVAEGIAERLRSSESPQAAVAEQMWSNWVVSLCHGVRYRLPDVHTAIVVHQNIAQHDEDDAVTLEDMQLASLGFIRSFKRLFPELWNESHFDFGKLVPPSLGEEPTQVQLATIALLRETPDFKIFSKYPKADKSHFVTLLKLAIQSESGDIRKETLSALRALLSRVFPLQDNEGSLDVLIGAVLEFGPECSTALVEYLETAFNECLRNSIVISDTIVRIVRTCSTLSEQADASADAGAGDAMDVDQDQKLSSPASDRVFRFPFPPILASLVRWTINAPASGLTTRFAAVAVQAVLQSIGLIFAVVSFDAFLHDTHWPDTARSSPVMRLCLGWTAACLATERNDAALEKPSRWKEGKSVIKAAEDFAAALEDAGPAFASKYIGKLLSAFDLNRRETLIFLQLHYPAAGNSLFEKTISDGDADWIRLLPLSVLLPNTLCPAASDDLAANEVLCASIEERFRDDQIDIPRLSRVTATLLLWTQASVRHVPSLKRARNRIAFALRLVRIALERAETLAAGDAASCSLRRHVLGHPLLLELFLQRKIAGLQQILGFARAADGVAMHEFISKLWARLDPAAIEGSAESISILLASLQALAPFIRASDLSERIHAFLSHNARSTTQERVLLALITHYVAASRSHSTGAVRMGRDLFKQLLLAVTSGDHDAAALFDDLVQEIGTLAGSAHGSSVSSSVITDRTLRLADGTTVEFALPLDVWSVLTPDALSTLLADTNSGPLWRFMLTNAAASVPHAVHLLGLARRPEKRSTGAILAIEQRAEAVCAVLKAWTILAAVNPWRLEWIERLPKTHLKLAQEAADAVADHYFAAIEACLEGNATPRHLAVDAHTLAAVLLAAGDKHASGWLMQLVPRLLKTKIIDANTSVQTLSRIWPALFSVAESAGIARLGDLVVFVLRAIYLQIKRDMPGRETAAAVESLVAQFSHPSDGSVAVVRFESMALVKSAITVILKHRLADPCALSFLRHLVDVVYSQHSDERLPSPKDLFDMITSHSQFDDILMAQADSPLPMAGDSPRSLIPQFHPAKSALLRLLHRIMLIEPTSCCMPDMVPRLAGSYFGTVAAADRATLAVLALFETHASISVAAHMASWAPSRPAPGEHAPAGNSASKLLHQPTDILSSIDPQWMAGSVRWFELNLDIDAIDKQAKGDIDSNAVSREPSALRASASEPAYDPTFILPLVAGALVHRPCTIDPHSLIESNALGMAIMALASTCESTRRVGHLIMSRAHHLIARSEIKERNQVMLLLDGLRNGIAPPAKAEPVPARIPTVIAAFGAQALSILTHPESDLYPLVNQFLLQRPIIDSEDVPMFYSMLYSTSELCGRERTWILRLLSAGLSLDVDYKPYKRRHVLEILMGAFHSSMVDATARKRLIEVMLRAVAIPAVLATLIGSSGMLGFLESCCSQVDFSEAPDTALGAAALVCATLRGFGAVAESWSDRGRINRSLWAMQLAQLARTLAARALHIQHGAPHRRAALTLRILTAVDLAQQVGAKIGLGSALIGAEDITTLLEATQQTYKAASVPGSPLADTYVPDEEDVDDGEDDDKNDNESESAEEGGEPQGRAQRAGSAAPGARTTIPGVRSSFQGDCGLAGDLDGVFIINRAALGHIGRNAIAAFFAIVGGAHVPWEVEAGDLGQTASLLRDIVSFARSAGIADATEPLLAWTVRHLLAAQGDRLVEWLVRESPSDLRDVLQIALDALASPGRDSKSGFRRWHLALAAALLVVRRWTDTDPSKPAMGHLDDWSTRMLNRAVRGLVGHAVPPRVALACGGIHAPGPLPAPAYEVVMLAQIVRLALGGSADGAAAWQAELDRLVNSPS